VLLVGHLADLIGGGEPFEHAWSKNAQLRTKEVETMQQRPIALGLYSDKLDHDLFFCGVSLNMRASSTKTECRAMRGIWAVRRYSTGGGLLLCCAMRDGHPAPLCNCGSQGNVSTSRLPFCAATR
jgi:hypothetical protein